MREIKLKYRMKLRYKTKPLSEIELETMGVVGKDVNDYTTGDGRYPSISVKN